MSSNIITGSDIITFGKECFMDCTSFTSITIGPSIQYIGPDCFKGCLNLETIIIGPNVQYIGDNCFQECTNLTDIIFEDQSTLTIVGTNILAEDQPVVVTYYNASNYDTLSEASKLLNEQFAQNSIFNYTGLFNENAYEIPRNPPPVVLYKNIGRGINRSTKFAPGGNTLCNTYQYLYNKYQPGGGGVGASSAANRGAKNRLATVCNGQKCLSVYSIINQYKNK